MAIILTPRPLALRAQFYQQFAQMTAAGMSVVNSLEMLFKGPPSASYREPIRQIILQLSHGATLTDAMRSLGRWMPDFDLALVQAGESSGRLDGMFKLLAQYYEDRARMLRQMIGDLAYPMFLLHFAIFLFPMISLFNGDTLPIFFLKTFGVLIPLYAVVLLLIYAAQNRRGAKWRSLVESVLRPVPVLGAARQALALSRLSAALEALISAGMNIIEAWDMAVATSGSPALQRAVAEWRPRVVGGETPAEAVSRSGQFPEMFANLYHTGEVSGQLDDSLRRLHNHYLEEGGRKMHLFTKWSSMMVYLLVVGFVAFKIIGFYTGYFNQVNEIIKM